MQSSTVLKSWNHGTILFIICRTGGCSWLLFTYSCQCEKSKPNCNCVSRLSRGEMQHGADLFALEQLGWLSQKTCVALRVQVPYDQPISESVTAALLSRPFHWQVYKMLLNTGDMNVIKCHFRMQDGESHSDYMLFVNIKSNLWHVLQ